ncbi:MAG TPA: glutaredoxin family protein [Candidatus Paceibacterota bacterium]|nr:glutaredoxin family protein [Candidatus Paceibacterota bacterium]
MPNIVIYTTPTCGYCKMAKEYFKSKGLDYTEHDVFADEKAREEMIAKSGQLGVPVITIDDNLVVGFDRPKIDQYLGAAGKEAA